MYTLQISLELVDINKIVTSSSLGGQWLLASGYYKYHLGSMTRFLPYPTTVLTCLEKLSFNGPRLEPDDPEFCKAVKLKESLFLKLRWCQCKGEA